MKAGTTTLFHDLRRNRHLALPEKEIGALTSDDILSMSGRRRYEEVFSGRRAEQLAGDISTTYTMLPERAGCAERARTLLPATTRIIYLIRNPVERIISHHRHELQQGTINVGIDEAVRTLPRFIARSQYARQLEPWVAAFGRDNVRVVRLEDYKTARSRTVTELCEFLGVPDDADAIDADRVYNSGRSKPLVRGAWRTIHDSALYRRTIRPHLTPELRSRIRHVLLPRSPVDRERPTASTSAFLVDMLADDLRRQEAMLGESAWSSDQLLRTCAAGVGDD
jgi:hypothetical protein